MALVLSCDYHPCSVTGGALLERLRALQDQHDEAVRAYPDTDKQRNNGKPYHIKCRGRADGRLLRAARDDEQLARMAAQPTAPP